MLGNPVMLGASRRQLVIHIGLERTGTTWLQFFLRENSKRLIDNLILYPMRNTGFRRNNHSSLVASYLPHDPNDVFLRVEKGARPSILKSLQSEIEAARAEKIILSSEHFSSRFREEQIQEFSADFADFDCKIVIFVRDHMSRLLSLYAVHVAGGGTLSINEYVDSILHPDNRTVRYAETIRAWEQSFGRANIRVCAYDAQRNIVERFFDVAGVGLTDRAAFGALKQRAIDPFGIRKNRSLGPRAIERLRAANARASDWLSSLGPPWPLAQRLTQPGLLYLFRFGEWLERSTNFAGRDLWTVDGKQLEELSAIARSDERWLRERYQVSLGGSPYSPT
jgi:hypothetical protein